MEEILDKLLKSLKIRNIRKDSKNKILYRLNKEFSIEDIEKNLDSCAEYINLFMPNLKGINKINSFLDEVKSSAKIKNQCKNNDNKNSTNISIKQNKLCVQNYTPNHHLPSDNKREIKKNVFEKLREEQL